VPIIRRNNYLCDTWYLSLFVDDCIVCIPDSQPHGITSTKCYLNSVVSPDDGHVVTQNT